jgi:glycerophosphoryl diester phosphodiesterase
MILEWLERASDGLMNLRRYPEAPDRPAPLVIAHRGAWDLGSRRENTMSAFQHAEATGMNGIEFDLHFTRDGVPVVHHDPHLLRFFGSSVRIEDLTLKELHARAPVIPEFDQVLTLSSLHFMIEIKTSLTPSQLKTLEQKTAGLTAGRDFHLLALDPDLVRVSDKFPARCWVLVGQLMLGTLVEISVAHGYGGVAGHYLGMTNGLAARLHAHGQKAGAGFISSKNLLNRERARGIDWVYTNTAENLK